MNDSEVILRYLYLGTDQPYYIQKNKPLDVKEGCRIMAPVKTLVEAVALQEVDDSAALAAARRVTLKEPPVDMIVRVSLQNCFGPMWNGISSIFSHTSTQSVVIVIIIIYHLHHQNQCCAFSSLVFVAPRYVGG